MISSFLDRTTRRLPLPGLENRVFQLQLNSVGIGYCDCHPVTNIKYISWSRGSHNIRYLLYYVFSDGLQRYTKLLV